MSNNTNSAVLADFINAVKPTQKFWALQDAESEDWVVLDSESVERTEVMPLWSSAELAKVNCIDEWQSFLPAEITLEQWLEFWVEDLKKDNVLVGLNWQDEGECLELELSDFSLALAEIEAY